MEAKAETLPKSGPPPKRLWRNYLLDPRFQLKYTSMVVVVTVIVASILGFFAYDYSRGQTEALMLETAMQPDLDPEVAAQLEGMAADEDQKVLTLIVSGILILAFTLGVTGILVTHKLCGPAYKLRLLLNQVAAGKLKLQGRLRKGDELQELFEAFANMVQNLRGAQEREIHELDEAVESARKAGVSDDQLTRIIEVRDRMASALE